MKNNNLIPVIALFLSFPVVLYAFSSTEENNTSPENKNVLVSNPVVFKPINKSNANKNLSQELSVPSIRLNLSSEYFPGKSKDTLVLPDFYQISGLWQIKGFKINGGGMQCFMETLASNGSQFAYVAEIDKTSSKIISSGFLLSTSSEEGRNSILKLSFDNSVSITFRAVVKSGALEMMMDENEIASRNALSEFGKSKMAIIEEVSTGNKLYVNLNGSMNATGLFSQCLK